ncbi:hypothetical protein NUSPORA_00337 [Nucleospora cyclopteri]
MKELIILQTHIDYSINLQSLEIQTPTITIYGKTVENVPIQIKIEDFIPYFYVQCNKEVKINDFENAVKKNFSKGKCLGVEKVQKKSIYGFTEENSTFYKIFFNSPSVFKSAKSFLETGVIMKKETVKCKIFESNFPFVLRFMNDLKMTGMCYIKLKNWEIIRSEPFVVKTWSSFIEILPLTGDFIKVLPMKILSFDIECCGETDSFPTAQIDPVIQIGNTICSTQGEKLEKVIFCLKEVEKIPGATVKWYENEADLLREWQKFVVETDPDIILGYNIKNFDFPYLLERAETLKIKNFGRLGRTEKVSKTIKKTQSSTGFGTLETSDIYLEGRMIFDLFHILKRDFKLRSYSLNSVSAHFLGEQKEDVPYSSMNSLQNGNKETRRRIATYCLKDTYLPVRIFDKLNIFINYVELSRATYVPIEFFSTRGSSIKVLSQIYRAAFLNNYVVPDMNITENESSYEGAFVMDPIKGFYSDPIAVLDFSSLYPSIMISKNLCYTTLISKQQFDSWENKEEVIQTPTGNFFVNKKKKEGLLPRILKDLLANRKETKALLKKTDDPWLKKSLDGRQLALKICANSIYGFTGATVGQLPCLEISQSTTAFGREMIRQTKNLIEENFSKTNKYSHDTQVIYGDTDSVMINFKENDMKAVFRMSKEIATFVSATFEKPVSLEFEKVYWPYLLMNKKRYAGLIYTTPEKADRIDSKGIESVRRDNCELVKTIIDVCLNKILYNRDVEGAVRFVKNRVGELYADKIDLSQLVISKTFTKNNYVVRSAHVELVERLRKRGVEVRIGDRIPYVIIAKDKKSKIYDKSEDPVYALENNLPIDTEYYIENQLKKPIQRLFEPIMDNINSLFQGEHAKKITINTGVVGPMNKFVTKREQCLGCKKGGVILCADCRKSFPKHLNNLQNEYNSKAKKYHECWSQCQRCMGSAMNAVLCVNRDCPIFYMRTKVKKEMVPVQEKINLLYKLDW